MVIDFHTHVFPDELAPKAKARLEANIDYLYTPCHDMTLKGLIQHMDKSGVDISVVQPVITRPSQFKSVNDFSASINNGRIVAFGAVHPETDDYKRDIDYIVSLGLKGIKFHPEYQSFILDDIKMLRVFDYAVSRGLILLFHAGYDPAMQPPYKSNPQRFANLIKELKGGTIVAAHYGGQEQWDDVERYLAGTDIYLDTSMALNAMDKAQFVRIFKAHGADKVLFASDSPWGDPGKDIATINNIPLTEEEKEKVFWKNSALLLGINND